MAISTAKMTPKTEGPRGPNSVTAVSSYCRVFQEDDWIKHRDLITRMYMQEQKALPFIQNYMQKNFKLRATQRMYKQRFKDWKLEKTLRPDEVLAMARVKVRRDAKKTPFEFWRHGKLVSPERLERFLRDRPDISQQVQDFASKDRYISMIESILPHHIIVLNPSRSLRSVTELDCTERTIYALQATRDRSVEWRLGDDTPSSTPWLYFAARHLKSSDPDRRHQAWLSLKAAFLFLETDICSNNLGTGLRLVYHLQDLIFHFDLAPVARMWADYAAQLSIHIHGKGHPWQAIAEGFIALHADPGIYARSMRVTLSAFVDIVNTMIDGQDHGRKLPVVNVSHPDHAEREAVVQKSLQVLGPGRTDPESALRLPLQIVSLLDWKDDHVRFLKIMEQMKENGLGTSLESHTCTLIMIACHTGLGGPGVFTHLFYVVRRSVLRICNNNWGPSDAQFLIMYIESMRTTVCRSQNPGFEHQEFGDIDSELFSVLKSMKDELLSVVTELENELKLTTEKLSIELLCVAGDSLRELVEILYVLEGGLLLLLSKLKQLLSVLSDGPERVMETLWHVENETQRMLKEMEDSVFARLLTWFRAWCQSQAPQRREVKTEVEEVQ